MEDNQILLVEGIKGSIDLQFYTCGVCVLFSTLSVCLSYKFYRLKGVKNNSIMVSGYTYKCVQPFISNLG